MVGWLFALLSYHSWVLFSSLTVTYVLYLNNTWDMPPVSFMCFQREQYFSCHSNALLYKRAARRYSAIVDCLYL